MSTNYLVDARDLEPHELLWTACEHSQELEDLCLLVDLVISVPQLIGNGFKILILSRYLLKGKLRNNLDVCFNQCTPVINHVHVQICNQFHFSHNYMLQAARSKITDMHFKKKNSNSN